MNKFKNAIAKIKAKLVIKASEAKEIAMDTRGDFTESAVKILIVVVVGGLFLAFLIALFNDQIFPGVKGKITEMFGMGN